MGAIAQNIFTMIFNKIAALFVFNIYLLYECLMTLYDYVSNKPGIERESCVAMQ